MTNRKWFFHMLRASLGQRKGRVLVAALSVGIASAVVVGTLGLSLGIRQKLGGELKAYGANAIVSKPGGYVEEASLSALLGTKGVEEYSGQLYAPVRVQGADAELMGIDTDRPYGWKLKGDMPLEGGALIGADLRDALKLQAGSDIKLAIGGREFPLKVSGFVESGGPEDGAVLMRLGDAQRLTGLEGKLSAVFVRAKTDGLEAAVKEIASRLGGAEVRTLMQVARAEESFLLKVELLMGLVSLVVVIASGISVSSTMGATVLERIKEIGLMKAIGGTRAMIRRFYLFEASLIGLMGGAGGYALGFVSAQAVSKGAFNSFINVPFYLIFLSLFVGVLIAVLASGFPLRPALGQNPSVILRGE